MKRCSRPTLRSKKWTLHVWRRSWRTRTHTIPIRLRIYDHGKRPYNSARSRTRGEHLPVRGLNPRSSRWKRDILRGLLFTKPKPLDQREYAHQLPPPHPFESILQHTTIHLYLHLHITSPYHTHHVAHHILTYQIATHPKHYNPTSHHPNFESPMIWK